MSKLYIKISYMIVISYNVKLHASEHVILCCSHSKVAPHRDDALRADVHLLPDRSSSRNSFWSFLGCLQRCHDVTRGPPSNGTISLALIEAELPQSKIWRLGKQRSGDAREMEISAEMVAC